MHIIFLFVQIKKQSAFDMGLWNGRFWPIFTSKFPQVFRSSVFKTTDASRQNRHTPTILIEDVMVRLFSLCQVKFSESDESQENDILGVKFIQGILYKIKEFPHTRAIVLVCDKPQFMNTAKSRTQAKRSHGLDDNLSALDTTHLKVSVAGKLIVDGKQTQGSVRSLIGYRKHRKHLFQYLTTEMKRNHTLNRALDLSNIVLIFDYDSENGPWVRIPKSHAVRQRFSNTKNSSKEQTSGEEDLWAQEPTLLFRSGEADITTFLWANYLSSENQIYVPTDQSHYTYQLHKGLTAAPKPLSLIFTSDTDFIPLSLSYASRFPTCNILVVFSKRKSYFCPFKCLMSLKAETFSLSDFLQICILGGTDFVEKNIYFKWVNVANIFAPILRLKPTYNKCQASTSTGAQTNSQFSLMRWRFPDYVQFLRIICLIYAIQFKVADISLDHGFLRTKCKFNKDGSVKCQIPDLETIREMHQRFNNNAEYWYTFQGFFDGQCETKMVSGQDTQQKKSSCIDAINISETGVSKPISTKAVPHTLIQTKNGGSANKRKSSQMVCTQKKRYSQTPTAKLLMVDSQETNESIDTNTSLQDSTTTLPRNRSEGCVRTTLPVVSLNSKGYDTCFQGTVYQTQAALTKAIPKKRKIRAKQATQLTLNKKSCAAQTRKVRDPHTSSELVPSMFVTSVDHPKVTRPKLFLNGIENDVEETGSIVTFEW